MDRRRVQELVQLEYELYNTNNLHRWLTWEGYSPLLLGGGFFLPWALVGVVAILAAVAAIPLFSKWLYELERRGWMIALHVFSVVPGLLAFFLASENQRLMTVVLAALPSFYIFVWILRMAVENWRAELVAQLEMLRDRVGDWR